MERRKKRADMTIAASARKLLLAVTLMIVAAAGCGDRSDSETPQQPPELRKKIAMPREPIAQPEKIPLEPRVAEHGTRLAQTGSERAVEPSLPEKKGLIRPKKSDSLMLAEGIGKRPDYFYDPRGKHDPFESPFETETERIVPSRREAKKKRLPLTPLQRVDLGQLKLVAVILAPTGNKALVEEPSGKGYIISKGTYVGTNFGRVKRVLKDRVVVEEETKDFLSGKMELQTTELTFPKNVGDV
ncbi:MAG: pilus assembly protein PilP [Deltaproteobacteria bacterium]|nr:pilus assembly protein PilP [Deltaproteobacteria bacterium]